MLGDTPTIHLTEEEYITLRRRTTVGQWLDWKTRAKPDAALQIGALAIFIDAEREADLAFALVMLAGVL